VAPTRLQWLRIVALAFSFLSLSAFGLSMIRPMRKFPGRNVWFLLTMLAAYLMGVLEIGTWLEWSVPDWLKANDAWTHYTLGIPGALLAAWGLLIQRRVFIQEGLTFHARYLVWAALAFALYGAIGQSVPPPSALFPSTVINTESFLATWGVPVQIFRAIMAGVIALFTIRALRAFDVHWRRQLAAAQQQAQEAIARRNTLRGELLRRSVTAQEEDRQRIARELHDEIGQTLTGLAMGLRGAQQSLNGDLGQVRLQLRQLEGMTVQAIGELSRLVSDLRPSLLDDLGLHAALGWYVDEINRRGSTQVELTLQGLRGRLPPEVESTLFRIAQEALNNVTRHAQASQATVRLACDGKSARLYVRDDGIGFDPAAVLEQETRPGWGLVGIQERAELAGGGCHIESAPGAGTSLTIDIPLAAWKEGQNDAHQVDAG
jgi:signal transduction histidine kinase